VRLVGSEPLVRPPGGQDEDAFIAACLRCEKCREVCPQGVVVTAALAKGVINARTPTANFKLGWCDFCQEHYGGEPQCVKVCPTEALRLMPGATPETVIIGKAYIVEGWCLGWQLKRCRVCVDACPYEALDVDGNGRPFVVYDKCNGCGLCENVCVSMMNTSITLNASDRAITVKTVEAVNGLLGTRTGGGAGGGEGL